MRVAICQVCGWIYEEDEGLPREGIPPGTPFEDLPEGWACPECNANKSLFEIVEI